LQNSQPVTYFLHDLHLNQVQLDELYATLSAVRDGELSEADAIERLSTSPLWVWTAIEPESKLMISLQVGDRGLAMAQAVLHQITQLLAPGCIPLFLSDGNPNYLPAIVSHFGHWVQPSRRHAKGSAPKPRWMPLPGLLYAQVVKRTRRRRIVQVIHRVVIGAQAQVMRSWPPVAGRSIRPLSSGSICACASGWRRFGGVALRHVRVKPG
jgi:hypothetical protein